MKAPGLCHDTSQTVKGNNRKQSIGTSRNKGNRVVIVQDMAMITRKRHGTLPPLAAGIENELLKPIAFNTENDKGILSHGFHPGASKSDLNSIPSLQDVGGCWESDHDFEEALSPATSSTASGPIYERPAGFEFHAHSIQVDKPKKKNKGVKIVSLGKDSGKKKEIYAKGKVKKGK